MPDKLVKQITPDGQKILVRVHEPEAGVAAGGPVPPKAPPLVACSYPPRDNWIDIPQTDTYNVLLDYICERANPSQQLPDREFLLYMKYTVTRYFRKNTITREIRENYQKRPDVIIDGFDLEIHDYRPEMVEPKVQALEQINKTQPNSVQMLQPGQLYVVVQNYKFDSDGKGKFNSQIPIYGLIPRYPHEVTKNMEHNLHNTTRFGTVIANTVRKNGPEYVYLSSYNLDDEKFVRLDFTPRSYTVERPKQLQTSYFITNNDNLLDEMQFEQRKRDKMQRKIDIAQQKVREQWEHTWKEIHARYDSDTFTM